MAYDYSSMNDELAATFGESVVHSPAASGTPEQTLTMIYTDPTTAGETIPGVFAILSGPISVFITSPVEGDVMTFRGQNLYIYSQPALLANGMVRLALAK